MRVLILAALAIVASSCLFDGAVPVGAAIACRDDAECPAGQVCSALLGGQCAPAAAGDNAPPTATVAVTPAAATVGTRVEVRVQSSEALGVDPVASIDLGAIRRPLVLEAGRATAGDLEFLFVYEPLGDEPPGPRAVVIDVVDRLGSATQALGSLALDFQAPRLAAPPTLLATTTNSEVKVTVDFVDDNDVVEVDVTMTPLEGGEPLTLGPDPEEAGTFSRVVEGAADGIWRVEIAARDAVGNAMATVEAGLVVVDRAAPQATSAQVSPAAVRRGDLVRLTLQTDEPLADDADVGQLVQVAPALAAEVIATVGAGNLREIVLRVADDAADGSYAVTMGPVRDVAGNTTATIPLGSVRVDGTAPRVAEVVVEGAPLNAEGVLEVTVVLDEPVAAAPLVQLGPTVLPPVDRGGTDAPHLWTYRLEGGAVAMEDIAELVVEATDLLGNRAAAIRTGTLIEVDTIAPRVVAAEPSTTGEAVQGENVSVFMVFSEPVVAPPELRWDGPTLAFAPMSTGGGRAFRFAAPVLVDSPAGDVRLVGVRATSDLAGNPVVAELPPMVLALRPQRCLPGQHFGAPAVEGRARCVDDDVCLDGHHFGGELSSDATIGRVCLPLGSCSPTHHDGGDGSCVVIGTCAPAHRRGGAVVDGVDVCVANDTCSPGFHFGSPAGRGVPECVPEDECSEGHHFGGRVEIAPIGRECVSALTCSVSFHDGGDGDCVLLDRCSPGFHDDDDSLTSTGGVEHTDPETGRRLSGIATCVPMRSCAFGFQIGQDPDLCEAAGNCLCVPDGECASGNHPGRPIETLRERNPRGALVDIQRATCVAPRSACSPGFHDGDGRLDDSGAADCIAIDECVPGFQIGQFIDRVGTAPDCTDNDSCTCVPRGTCAVGFHPGEPVAPGQDAVCVPDNVCLTGSRNDGHGNCIGPEQPCARGFHDGGDGLCLPRGRCSDGANDDGTGTCRSVNEPCAPGYRDDGTGTCRPDTEPCAPGMHDDGSGAVAGLPGQCVGEDRGCAVDGLHDGGDGNCLVKGTCAPGFSIVGDVCAPTLSCVTGTHDGGDGRSCVPEGSCAVGFTLFGDVCRPATPTFGPGVFENACDPETTGRVGADGGALRVDVDEVRLATAAVLECRVGDPTTLHTVAFGPCDAALALGDSGPGLVRLEVRAVVDLDGQPVVSRSAMHSFTVHESLDAVACCPAPVSDADWLAATGTLLATTEAFSPLSSAAKPYVFADGGEAKLDVISLRHRFALSADRRLLLVTRSAVSSTTGTCSGVRVRLGDSSSITCPEDESWILPVHNGDDVMTASLTCTEVDDGCRRFRYTIEGGGRRRVLFEREDCADTRHPYELFHAATQQCEALVVNAAGDALCLDHDAGAIRVLDAVEGAGADLGIRILNNRGKHRAFSRLHKQGL